MSMERSDVVFDLIVKMFCVEGDHEQLRTALELYALAYYEDLETVEAKAFSGEIATPGKLPVEETSEVLSSAEMDVRDWNEAPKGYKGFLTLRCAHCGEETSYSSKYHMTHHKCRACGKHTELLDMTATYPTCECGQRSRYMTNQTQPCFDIPCVSCGSLVPVEYRSDKHIYATAGVDEVREKGE